MTTPTKPPRARSESPLHVVVRRPKSPSSFRRQSMIWTVSLAMFFCVFLAWNNELYIGFSNEPTVNKAFQVNAKTNHTGVVRQISLIGERNSGTKWMWAHLADCFNHSIPVEKKFSRYKHWFQPKDYWRYPHDTLVIAEFRNPYDWLMAMHDVPHHAPAHAGLKWKEFLKKPWTTKRTGLDLEMKGDEMCQHHFRYKDIVSCVHKPEPHVPVDKRHSLDKPFYEMRNDGSGKPYKNIMELRSDKIRNILEIKDFPGVADLWMVQYEYLLSHGTQGLLDGITEWTGIEPQCKAYPAQFRRQRNITEEFVRYVTDHLNWTVEAHIGYEPMAILEEDDDDWDQ